jgi:hypothetical protein
MDDSTTQTRSSAFLRGFIEGAASLLDIFRVGAIQRRRGTPEDDARALLGDVEEIGRDFHAVLSGIELTSKK